MVSSINMLYFFFTCPQEVLVFPFFFCYKVMFYRTARLQSHTVTFLFFRVDGSIGKLITLTPGRIY